MKYQEKLHIMAGPCVIEGRDHALKTAHFLKDLCEKHGVSLIYKSSFDKANRSSIHSYRGPGLQEGLAILSEVKAEIGCPIVTDFHLPSQAAPVAEVCDILQVPAFLCRQTDLLVAGAKTGKIISVKKGQFMAPWDMKQVVEKLEEAEAAEIILTDRGTSFGYNNLVSDMRGIPIMKRLGHPVCFDASHSVQLPGGLGDCSGGNREHIVTLAMSALAAGADLLFIEAHPDPDNAKCDRMSQLPFEELEAVLPKLKRLHEAVCHDTI